MLEAIDTIVTSGTTGWPIDIGQYGHDGLIMSVAAASVSRKLKAAQTETELREAIQEGLDGLRDGTIPLAMFVSKKKRCEKILLGSRYRGQP